MTQGLKRSMASLDKYVKGYKCSFPVNTKTGTHFKLSLASLKIAELLNHEVMTIVEIELVLLQCMTP